MHLTAWGETLITGMSYHFFGLLFGMFWFLLCHCSKYLLSHIQHFFYTSKQEWLPKAEAFLTLADEDNFQNSLPQKTGHLKEL